MTMALSTAAKAAAAVVVAAAVTLIPVVFRHRGVGYVPKPRPHSYLCSREFSSLPPCCDLEILRYYHWFDKSAASKKRVIPGLFFVSIMRKRRRFFCLRGDIDG
ncbi:hypothetical protein KCP70_08825 [Salmonella enterica subsp. enterica]|nr:hypothetical protein KCP70_08825 [Salmonella enterica subsp. enterica]